METGKRKDSCRLKPPKDQSPGGPRGVSCEVAAFASVRIPYDSLPDVRRNPEPVFGLPLPTSTFKHLDEQTVAGLAAVCRAIRDYGLDPAGFREWGVLAAPHFLGQSLMVTSLNRFHAEGAWGVSPHVIPHHSLHSISGTVSQVFKIHGPNLGVGGGQGGTAETLLAASAWLGHRRVPGAWVVITTLEGTGRLDDEGHPPAECMCVALAIALLPTRTDSSALRLRFSPADGRATARPLDLGRLSAALEQSRTTRGAGGQVVSTAPRVDLEWGRAGWPVAPHGMLLKSAELHSAVSRMSSGVEADR
jgi:hypothetical protein